MDQFDRGASARTRKRAAFLYRSARSIEGQGALRLLGTMGLLVLLFVSPALCQLADSPWPDYGGGLRNNHRSAFNGPSQNIRVVWNVDIPYLEPVNGIYHQPVISRNGTIVVSNSTWSADDSLIVGVSPQGAILWSKTETVTSTWLAADAAGRIIYGRYLAHYTGGRTMRAISEVDGALEWSVGLPDGLVGHLTGPTVAPDGNIYIGRTEQASWADDATLSAVSSDGTVRWTAHASGYNDNPAIAADGTIVTGGRRVYAVSSEGVEQWTFPSGNVFAPAIGDNNVIYVGTEDKRLLAIDMSGTELWSVSGPGGAPGIGPDGTIYCGGYGTLYAVSDEGSVKWTYQYADPGSIPGDFAAEGPTIDAAGNIYLSTPLGEVLSLDPQGNVRWSIYIDPEGDFPQPMSAPIIGGEGILYVGAGSLDKLYAIVPEPATLFVMAAAGLPALLRRRRRRNRNPELASPCRELVEPGLAFGVPALIRRRRK